MILHCANCEIEIRWKPTKANGRAYCCAGCAEGGPCECDYDRLPPAPQVIRHIRFEIVELMETANALTNLKHPSSAILTPTR